MTMMADEEAEDICRFCRSEGSREKPLFYPCLCTGSIKYIHQDCLEQWLQHSKKQYCELCNHRFAFRPVYAAGAPNRLPVGELVLGVLQQCVGTLRYALRLGLVLFCWLVVMPFITTCIWRLFFFPQDLWPPHNRLNAMHIMMDCVEGCAIASSILFVFLALMALNNFLTNNLGDDEDDQHFQQRQMQQVREHRQRQQRQQRQQQQQLVLAPPPNNRQHRPNQQPAAPPQMQPHTGTAYPPLPEQSALNDEHTHGGEGENTGEEDTHGAERWGGDGGSWNEADEDASGSVPTTPLHPPHQSFQHMRTGFPGAQGGPSGEHGVDGGSMGGYTPMNDNGGGDIPDSSIRAYNEWAAAQQAAAGGEGGEEIYPRLDNEDEWEEMDENYHDDEYDSEGDDGGDRDEEGDFEDEEDGMGGRGAAQGGAEDNNLVNFGLAAFFEGPHEDVSFEELVGLTGPLVNLVENMFWVLLFISVFVVTFAFMPFILGAVATNLIATCFYSLKRAAAMLHLIPPSTVTDAVINATVAANITLGMEGNGTVEGAVTQPLSPYEFVAPLVDTIIGYCMVALFGAFYLSISSMLTPMNSVFGKVLRQTMQFFCVFVKVCMLLLVELGVFPLLCGWWLDVCTLVVLDATLADRTAYFTAAPITSSFLHWLVGMLYMSHFASFVALMREELRPGVLWFLRNPNDPAFQPVREMVELPLGQHMRRILLSTIMYGLLILILVYLPVKACCRLGFAPLQMLFTEPVATMPIDLLLFHVVVPVTLESLSVRQTCKYAMATWLRWVGCMLEMDDYLLGPGEVGAGHGLPLQGLQPGPPGLARPGQGNGAERWEDEWEDMDAGVATEGEIEGPALPPGGFQALNPINLPPLHDMPTDPQLQPTITSSKKPDFPLKVMLFLLLAWFSLLLVNMAFLTIPVGIGRAVLRLSLGHQTHDLYSFAVGFYALWGGLLAANWALAGLQASNKMRTVWAFVARTSILASKGLLLFVVGGVLIPVTTGLLFELLLVTPLFVPPNENAVFHLLQSWALGCVLVKMVHRIVMAGPANEYKDILEQGAGLEQMALKPVFERVAWPLVRMLVLALTGPYVIVRGLLPWLGASYHSSNLCFRYSYVFCAIAAVLYHGHRHFHRWLRHLHDSVRDSKYLVRRQLLNHSDMAAAAAATAAVQ